MVVRRLSIGFLAFLLGVMGARSAAAQATPTEKAAAEALFDEGVRLMHAGQFTQACPKLEASGRIDPGVGTLLYLGECYERTERTASAWATFREAASMAKASNQPDRAKVAQRRVEQLEPALSWLTIDVSSEARAVSGLTVRRAGLPVDPSLWGVATPIDVGEVLIEASAPGRALFSSRIAIHPTRRSIITIPALAETGEPKSATALVSSPTQSVAPPPAQVPPAASLPVDNAPEVQQSRRAFPVLPAILAGAGIVGVGIGSYFGLNAISKASDANDLCPDGRCTEQRGETLMEDARDSAKISNIAFGVGAAALATGVILYFTSPTAESTSSVGLLPVIDTNSAGLALEGRL